MTTSPEKDAPPLAVVLSNANGGNAPEGRPVQGCMNDRATPEKGAGLDYPTAWQIAVRVAPEYHHNRCSYNVTSGGMLCDCDVLTKSPEYAAAYVLPSAVNEGGAA